MSWSFDVSLNTDKDYVRYLIGDTNTNRQLVQDETIEAVLQNEANVWMTAADIIVALYRGLTAAGSLEDRKVGETRIRYQRISDLMANVAGLKARGSAHMKPSAGGVIQSETDSYDKDTSLDKPEIAKRMHRNPRAVKSVTNKTS
jgi:hypothetical protein